MNKKSTFIFKMILGLYLAYIGVQLIIDVTREQPSNLIFTYAMSVLFIIIGVGYAFQNIKKILPPKEDNPKEKPQDEKKQVYKRPVTDKTTYRTAPMPDLRSVELKTVPKEETEAGAGEIPKNAGETDMEDVSEDGQGEVSLELEDETDFEEV